jgi:polysaccharide biosynthesis transport protein
MSQVNEARPLRDYLRVVASRKWLIVLTMLACMSGALAMVALQDPVYEAEALIAVRTQPGDSLFGSSDQQRGSDDRVLRTEIRVLESDLVYERLLQNLGLEGPVPRASGRADGTTFIVGVNVRSGTPEVSQALADGYVQAYLDTKRDQVVSGLDAASQELENQIEALEAQIVGLDAQVAAVPENERLDLQQGLASQRQYLVNQQAEFKQRLDQIRVDASLSSGGAQLVQPARLPGFPIEPTPKRTLAVALLFGLLLGLGAAFLVDFLDDSIDDPRELEKAAGGSPVLSIVPTDPPPDNRPIAISRPGDTAVEAYRTLRTNVQFLGLDQPLRIVQITSSIPGEGKTTTAANLAVVLAQAGKRVVLVDADLRRPRLHEVFGLPGNRGLTDVLVGEPVELVLLSVPVEGGQLDLLPAGRVPPNPSEMLGGQRMKALLESLSTSFDVVVVDSAPVLPVTDSVVLSSSVDAVLVVAQAGRSSVKMVKETVLALNRVSAPVAGVVMNRVAQRKLKDGYGYGYGYGYAPTASSTTNA